jgi:hypothetical protein
MGTCIREAAYRPGFVFVTYESMMLGNRVADSGRTGYGPPRRAVHVRSQSRYRRPSGRITMYDELRLMSGLSETIRYFRASRKELGSVCEEIHLGDQVG